MYNYTGSIDFIKNIHSFFTGLNTCIYSHKAHKQFAIPADIELTIGSATLFNYSSFCPHYETTTPILAIPSKINKPYVLDLEERSLIRWLATRGIIVYMLDWGEPGDIELQYNIDKYINNILLPIIKYLFDKHQGPINVIGYCFGGTITLGASSIWSEYINKIALLATPWDYREIDYLSICHQPLWQQMLGEIGNICGKVPGRTLNMLFSLLQPDKMYNKYVRVASSDNDSEELKLRLSIDRWANDNISISIPVMQDFVHKFICQNITYNSKWRINDKLVQLTSVTSPILIVTAEIDSIVPSKSSLALVDALPNAKALSVHGSHVGMIVGDKTRDTHIPPTLWPILYEWFKYS
jgi:polyhydroxyalkanoate synthase